MKSQKILKLLKHGLLWSLFFGCVGPSYRPGYFEVLKDGSGVRCFPRSSVQGIKEQALTSVSDQASGDFPKVITFSPQESNYSGGTLITISGQGFEPSTQVLFGDAPCIGVTVKNSNTLSCFTSAHAPQLVDLTLVNSDRKCDVQKNAFRYVQTVSITPKKVRVSYDDRVEFFVSHGVPPYQFSVVSGEGKIDPNAGVYLSPAKVGTTMVKVQDSAGVTDTAIIQINQPLQVVLPNQATAVKNVRFIAASGGVAPYRFYTRSPGVLLDSYSGRFIATQPLDPMEVEVRDVLGHSALASLKIFPEISVRAESTRLVTFSKTQVLTEGGIPPYTYSIASGPGKINPATGLFESDDRTGLATIQVKDSMDNTTQVIIEIRPPLAIFPSEKTLLVGDRIPFKGMGGLTPYQFVLKSGFGLLNQDTGEFTASETPGNEVIELRDALGNSVEARVKVTPGDVVPHLISAGLNHSCAIHRRSAKCWGENIHGQLGNGSFHWSHVPTQVRGLEEGVLSIVAGYYHTCALLAGGSVKCWGDNSKGQLGIYSVDGTPLLQSAVPIQVAGLNQGVLSLASGQFHTCAVKEGGVLCWGDNSKGQLGTLKKKMSAVPMKVPSILLGTKAVATGSQHTCALIDSGVKCWGSNFDGQLGNQSRIDSFTPVAVKGLESGVQAIDARGNHTCALVSSKVMCWGFNASGQLGNQSVRSSDVPVAVENLDAPVEELAVGDNHTCVRVSGANPIQCWGYNFYGQGGQQPQAPVLQPNKIQGLPGRVDALGAGVDHTCILSQDSISCWGKNTHGQLGNNSVKSSYLPSVPSKMN